MEQTSCDLAVCVGTELDLCNACSGRRAGDAAP